MEEIRISESYVPVIYHDGAEPSLCATNLNKSENYLKDLSADFIDFSKDTSDKLDKIQNTTIPQEVAKGVLAAKSYTDEQHNLAIQHTNQEISTLSDTVDSNKSLFDDHVVDATNPHRITKDIVGLGNVENLSSEQLRNLFTGSIDTLTDGFITLDDAEYILRQLQLHQNTRDNPHEVSASQVGLGNVENKSVSEIKEDLEGPVSETSEGFVLGSNVYGFVKQSIEKTEEQLADVTSKLTSAINANSAATSANAQNIQYNSTQIEQNTSSITTNSSNIEKNSTRIEQVYASIPTKMSQLENDGGYLTSLDLGDDLIFNCGTSR